MVLSEVYTLQVVLFAWLYPLNNVRALNLTNVLSVGATLC